MFLRSSITLALVVALLGLAGGVNAATINIFGLPNTPLGSATLTPVGGTLVVSNIGSTGADGVSVGVPAGTTYFDAYFNPLYPQSYQPGSFLKITDVGTLNGVPNQVAGTGLVTDLGLDWGINVSFSPLLSSAPIVAQYYAEGVFVGSEVVNNDPGNEWLMAANNTASDVGSDGKDPQCPNCLASVDLSFPKATNIISPTGQNFLTDTIIFSPLSFSVGATFTPSAANITGSGISSLTLTTEVLTVVAPEPSTLFLIGLGFAGMAGLLGRDRWWSSV